jgi:hypothetical protein
VRPECVAASRAADVRRAARAWERAGVIDGPTRAAIESAQPSDGHPHAMAWRVAIFVIASVATVAAFAAFAGILRGGGAASWLFFGVVLAAATEALDRSSLRGNGAAGATSFWAVVTISAGFAALAEKGGGNSGEVEIGLFVAALAFALACWRWGFEVYGAFGAVAFFFLLAQFSGARALWIAAALVLLAGAFRLLDRAALAPEHRAAAAGVFGTSAVALYAAINLYSVDRRVIETVRGFHGSTLQPSATAQAAAAFATALLPLVFLVWGIRTRRRRVLDLGAVFAALSLATLRYYVHLAPLWTILCVAGAALLILALAVNRKLRRSPDGEWGGFTARPLYSGMGALPAAAVVAGFAPEARLTPAPQPPGFTGGGGTSGGGGATGSF